MSAVRAKPETDLRPTHFYRLQDLVRFLIYSMLAGASRVGLLKLNISIDPVSVIYGLELILIEPDQECLMIPKYSMRHVKSIITNSGPPLKDTISTISPQPRGLSLWDSGIGETDARSSLL